MSFRPLIEQILRELNPPRFNPSDRYKDEAPTEVLFKGAEYQTYNPKGELVRKTMTDYKLPMAMVFEFSRAKIINNTVIGNNVGSIKEFYGFEDWTIAAKGVLFSNQNMPSIKEQKEALLVWEQLADAIDVQSELFASKEIYKVVIQDIRFSPVVGKPNILPFSMSMVSDTSYELLVNL